MTEPGHLDVPQHSDAEAGWTRHGEGVLDDAAAEIERYRTLVEGASDGIFVSDLAGRYLDANPAACEMLGYARDELLGLTIADIVAPEHVARLPEHIAKTTITPEKSEWRFRRKDGSTFEGEVNVRRLPDARLLAVLRDITPLQSALQALRESESRFRALIDDLEVGVVLQDAEDRILIVNEAAKSMLGISSDPSGLTSRDPRWQLIQEDGSAFPPHRVPSVLAARTLQPVRNVLLGALNLETGARKWLQVTASPRLHEGGGLKHVLVTIIDVTDRLSLEEQLRQSQKMQAVGQLAGGVAHDFNNVLTVITNYSDMLLRQFSDAPAPVSDALHAIRDAGQRAALVTRQLLVFSRKTMVEPHVLDLNDIVGHAVRMLRRLIPEHITLTTTLAPDLSHVRLDPGQIEQVILNLTLNARDAMDRGGVLTITTRNADIDAASVPRSDPAARPGRFVQLIVSDTGSGMTPHVRSHLFEPFFTTKDVGKGTGLGLATIYGIVRASGGFISVATAEGLGTTVTVSLPVAEEALSIEPRLPLPRQPEHGTETILLVEDESAVRLVVRRALEFEGYTVIESENGRTALTTMERNPGMVDLLLTDVVMPEMNGHDLALQVRSRFPDCRILLMSGYFDEEVAPGEKNGEVAALPLLRKPFSLAELSTRVREVLTRPA